MHQLQGKKRDAALAQAASFKGTFDKSTFDKSTFDKSIMNKSYHNFKGFAKCYNDRPSIAAADATEIRIAVAASVIGDRTWSKDRLLKAIAFLNIAIHRATVAADAIKVLKRPKYRPSKKGSLRRRIRKGSRVILNKIKYAAQKGIDAFKLPFKSVASIMRRYWEIDSISISMLKRLRNLFSNEWGLFDVKSSFQAGTRAIASEFQNFNLPKALIAYEQLELLLKQLYPVEQQWGESPTSGLENLPAHRGFIVPMVFNKLFEGVMVFGRNQDAVAHAPRSPQHDVKVDVPVADIPGLQTTMTSDFGWGAQLTPDGEVYIRVASEKIHLVFDDNLGVWSVQDTDGRSDNHEARKVKEQIDRVRKCAVSAPILAIEGTGGDRDLEKELPF